MGGVLGEGGSGVVKRKTAFKYAIECVVKERRLHAFDRNLGVAGVKSPRIRIATANYDRCTKTINILKEESECYQSQAILFP